MRALTRRTGLLAALLAVWGQLLLATLLPQPAAGASLADLLGDPGAICHAGGADPGHPGRMPPDCPLCPVCAVLHHAVPLPASPPAMPRRRAGSIGVVVRAVPPASPPPVPRLAAEPRGPPVLS
jgi:hypothetical protein